MKDTKTPRKMTELAKRSNPKNKAEVASMVQAMVDNLNKNVAKEGKKST